MSGLLSKVKDLAKPTLSFRSNWKKFGDIDPAMHLALDKQSHLDDTVTSKGLGLVGLDNASDWFNKQSNDTSNGVLHHLLAGAAVVGGGALVSGMGAGSAGASGAGEGLTSGSIDAAGTSVAPEGGGVVAGDAAPEGGDFVFNAAQDSQAANVQGGLGPVTSDDTLNGLGSNTSSGTQQQFRPQKQKQAQAIPYSPINGLSSDQYQALLNQATSQIAQSSKSVKTRGATQAAMQRGLAGAHPVDTNGVHIAAIQELNRQIDELGAQIAAAKAKRAAKKGAGA